jgi:hypothetical protein
MPYRTPTPYAPTGTAYKNALLRQRVERIARAPLARIDSAIQSLDPEHGTVAAVDAQKVEAALAVLAGDTAEAPVPVDPRDLAARRIQNAWRRSRQRSRSRRLVGQILAQLVELGIVGHGGGKALVPGLAEERAGHIRAMGTMLDMLAAHRKTSKAADLSDLIARVEFDSDECKRLFPRATRAQRDALERGLRYLSNSARASYRVEFVQGKLVWRGAPFDTSGMESHWSSEGRAIFVMDQHGRFYAAEQNLSRWEDERFHHSSFLSGAPVHGAGEMQVAEGRLEVLTAQSGHYKPTVKEMLQTMRQLAVEGVRFYRIAAWARDKETASQLRVRFKPRPRPVPPSSIGDLPKTVYPESQIYPDEDGPVQPGSADPAAVRSQDLHVLVPAEDYLFDTSLQGRLLLFDPTAK